MDTSDVYPDPFGDAPSYSSQRPDVGHHRLGRAICAYIPPGPGEPAGPRRGVGDHRTGVDDRLRVPGQQVPAARPGRPRIWRRLARRMRG